MSFGEPSPRATEADQRDALHTGGAEFLFVHFQGGEGLIAIHTVTLQTA